MTDNAKNRQKTRLFAWKTFEIQLEPIALEWRYDLLDNMNEFEINWDGDCEIIPDYDETTEKRGKNGTP